MISYEHFPDVKLQMLLDKSAELGKNQANKVMETYFNYLMRKNMKLLVKLNEAVRSEPTDPWTLVRTKFLADPSVPMSCSNKFYEVLTKYQFLEESEILECISHICCISNPEYDFSFWKRCPWIKEIMYDEKTKLYTIVTTKGNFSFIPVTNMYPNEINVIRTVMKGKQPEKIKVNKNGFNPSSYENFDYQCHAVSYEYSKLHPDDYAVTAICPNSFPNSYWLHSYNISYNKSYVIDISNGFVMGIDEYMRLIHPQVLDQRKGDDLPRMIECIESDPFFPIYKYLKEVPLKALAFYSYSAMSHEERETFKL